MEHWTYLRRAAHAALTDAFGRMGLLPDHYVLPSSEDFRRLEVRSDNEIHWCEAEDIALIYFDDDASGFVSGDNIYKVLLPGASVEAEDLDLILTAQDVVYLPQESFLVDFDITDVLEEWADTWKSAPLRELKNRKPRTPRVIATR